MKLLHDSIIKSIAIAIGIFVVGVGEDSNSLSVFAQTKIDGTVRETISGLSGGSVDSKGCGFIANTPNHTFNIPERVDYMRLTLQTSGGQPTLLVLGPKPEDRFCVLGEASRLQPEISGVWEAGKYQIYVGDRLGENYQFTLDISTRN
ncbi:hypothetical protein [Myxosarcina sp. GI1]|uniref:hypothetical protein n=1 Tax=Myxosarcina sp. GI1 TaxID=1541065 RepID=UPI00055AD175|nr:hypothetical protein [Myxosarcina sp. GI1]